MVFVPTIEVASLVIAPLMTALVKVGVVVNRTLIRQRLPSVCPPLATKPTSAAGNAGSGLAKVNVVEPLAPAVVWIVALPGLTVRLLMVSVEAALAAAEGS